MIIDLERISTVPDRGAFDVCIVGAGAAGIVLALELARHGRNVVLLEGGGLAFEARSQALYAGDSVGLQYDGIYNGRSRVLGGTTTLWGGQILEIDRHIFGERRDIPGSGWPFSKEELATAYRRAEFWEGLEDCPENAQEIWRLSGRAPPDLGQELNLGFSRWCPERNLAQRHMRVLRNDPNILLVLHSNVCEIKPKEDSGVIRAVEARTLTGRRTEFSAHFFALAMGGIEVCRLLLQPIAGGRPGPWAAGGLVGRHFQDHISCFIATLESASATLDGGLDYFAAGRYKYHPKIRLTAEAQARYGTLDICGTVATTNGDRDDLAIAYETYRLWKTRQLRSITPARMRHFAAHAPELLWHRMPYARRRRSGGKRRPPLRLCVHCEQSPMSAGQISLGPVRDALGLLQPRITWAASELELHSIRTFLRIFGQAVAARGLARVIPDDTVHGDNGRLADTFRESFHHIGGTRMAASPSAGVVNPDLRLYGTTNVYVCSTSVFPCAGFANPTHTLLALAVRLAAHLSAKVIDGIALRTCAEAVQHGERAPPQLAHRFPEVQEVGK